MFRERMYGPVVTYQLWCCDFYVIVAVIMVVYFLDPVFRLLGFTLIPSECLLEIFEELDGGPPAIHYNGDPLQR